MKKILPVNINPYIRTFAYHGYHHSVISSNGKVLNDLSEDVACVQVKNFAHYIWENQVEDLHYEINTNNTLRFYGNKWNTNMNAAFWRSCNTFDEIEITIHKQLYSNVWANICLFLASNSESAMAGANPSYNIQIGNFSKDGLYYRIDKEPHTVLYPAPALPLSIRLIKHDSHISIVYNDAAQTEKKITLSDDTSGYSLDRIGFAINLGCNSYYEWMFSNYINFYVNIDYSMPVDYLCNKHKNWVIHTDDYFIDYSAETEQSISTLGLSMIDYIKKMIDLNRYIETITNNNIYLNKSDINGKLFHQDLIYGYDDSMECFYLLYYKFGKVYSTTMLYKDFMSDRNFLKNRILYIYNYNPGYELYQLTPLYILQVFREYRESQNITFYEPQYEKEYFFGIKGLNNLLSDRGQKVLLSDIRVSHLLYERSKCNHDRIEYLFYKKILDEKTYEEIYELSQQVCIITLGIRNLIIKKRFKKIEEDAIINYLKKYIVMENELTDKIICGIEKSM